METAVEKIGMPLDEFIRLYDVEGPFELINGERRPLMVNVAGHGEVAQTLFLALHRVVSASQLGGVLHEQTFVLSDVPNWVTGSRQPDVAFYKAERINAYKEANPDWKLKPYILVPDLAVEVLSPNDNLTELEDKVDQYLLDGVQRVWVLNPQKQKVSVYTLTIRQPFTKQETYLTVNDTLNGNDLVPGFEIAVARLFA
jgi:Uma2 family endonuclease